MIKQRFFVMGAIAYSLLMAVYGQTTIKPTAYWTFNGTNPLTDSMDNSRVLKFTGEVNYRKAQVGKALDLGQSSSLASNKPVSTAKQSLSIAFVYQLNLRPDNVSAVVLVYNSQTQIAVYPNMLRWVTFHEDKSRHNWDIPLNALGKQNLHYLLDDKFHHWVFVFNAQKGVKQCWLDGDLVAEESIAAELKKNLVDAGVTYLQMNHNDRRNYGVWDEIAFYNVAISPNLIAKHGSEIQQGKSFSFIESPNFAKISPVKPQSPTKIDYKEYAPGHPNVTLSANMQLKSFPAPRYKAFHHLYRNVNWIAFAYYDKSDHSQENIELKLELARNWYYYLSVGQNIAFVPEAGQIEMANQNPWFPLMVISGWGFVNKKNYFPSLEKGTYIGAQNKPLNHYLTDKNGKLIGAKRQWSPASPLDSIRKDGQIQRWNFEKYFAKELKRPIDFISENGEVFSHPYKDSILQLCPQVVQDKQKRFPTWDYYTYQSYRRYQADSTYKAELMSQPLLKNAIYSYYEIMGEKKDVSYQYAQIRKLHTPIRGTCYATHSFYPAAADFWANTAGWRHGWYYTARARSIELPLGDKWFSPFVTTGFSGNEEENLRPGRWLGLMKALGAAGAEFYNSFFYTSKQKSDVKNYIWMSAMSSYSQAITSHYSDIFFQGNVLAGDIQNPETNFQTPLYRFWTGNPNHLVVVRKHNHQEKYLITGTIQPMDNTALSAPISQVVSIDLNGEKLTFEIRQQGSTYIYDKSNGKIVFYQLDKWHQYEHPAWWSKNIAIEAEVSDSIVGGKINYATDLPNNAQKGDVSSFTSYISASNGTKIAYFFQPRNILEHQQFSLKIRARVKQGGNANLAISFDANSLDYKQPNVYTGKKVQNHEVAISGGEWKWYNLDNKDKKNIIYKGFQPDTPQTLWLVPSSDKIEIDEIILEAK